MPLLKVVISLIKNDFWTVYQPIQISKFRLSEKFTMNAFFPNQVFFDFLSLVFAQALFHFDPAIHLMLSVLLRQCLNLQPCDYQLSTLTTMPHSKERHKSQVIMQFTDVELVWAKSNMSTWPTAEDRKQTSMCKRRHLSVPCSSVYFSSCPLNVLVLLFSHPL